MTAIIVIIVIINYYETKSATNPKRMTKIWENHLSYTKSEIMRFINMDDSSKSLYAPCERHLILKQNEFGNLFAEKYGKKVADDISSALRGHIWIN